MNLLKHILKRAGARRAAPPEEESLDGSLEAAARRLRQVDPQTSRQWHVLNAAIENLEVAAPPPQRPAVRIRFATAGVSMVILAALVISVLYVGREPSMLTYETGKGQQSRIMLPDSSEVTLNHTTEFTVNPTSPGGARVVALKGEAFFRVRRNGVPFTVSTDVGTVQVLGTEFNVRLRDGRLEVAVIAGSVRVSAESRGKDSSVVLGVGEIASCKQGGFPGTPERLFSPDYPGWLHGKLLFQKTSLRSVCREIEAQFDVTVAIEKPQAQEETITGALDARSADAALATLSQLTGTGFRHEKGVYTLY
jgi:ferric-dicitrate binding protein FerR (iron transport regulator)